MIEPVLQAVLANYLISSLQLRTVDAQSPARRKSKRCHLSLTLADLGGVRERILHTLPDVLRNFDTVSARPGHERNLMRPYFAAHRGDGVAEGREGLWIPCSGSDLEFPSFGEVVCE